MRIENMDIEVCGVKLVTSGTYTDDAKYIPDQLFIINQPESDAHMLMDSILVDGQDGYDLLEVEVRRFAIDTR